MHVDKDFEPFLNDNGAICYFQPKKFHDDSNSCKKSYLQEKGSIMKLEFFLSSRFLQCKLVKNTRRFNLWNVSTPFLAMVVAHLIILLIVLSWFCLIANHIYRNIYLSSIALSHISKNLSLFCLWTGFYVTISNEYLNTLAFHYEMKSIF